MSDPIRDALREAGEAFCRYPDGLRCDATLPTCGYCIAGAAAAVAAFLRALPACDVMMDRPEGAMHSTRTLAAAAERAAKEGA